MSLPELEEMYERRVSQGLQVDKLQPILLGHFTKISNRQKAEAMFEVTAIFICDCHFYLFYFILFSLRWLPFLFVRY